MKLLIVGDDQAYINILNDCLCEDENFVVDAVVPCEDEALQYVQSASIDSIDCVLIDLQLAKTRRAKVKSTLTGLSLAFELRRRHGFCGTIIVLTNSRSLRYGECALAVGCDGYVCKYPRMEDVAKTMVELKAAIKGEFMVVAREIMARCKSVRQQRRAKAWWNLIAAK